MLRPESNCFRIRCITRHVARRSIARHVVFGIIVDVPFSEISDCLPAVKRPHYGTVLRKDQILDSVLFQEFLRALTQRAPVKGVGQPGLCSIIHAEQRLVVQIHLER